MILKIFLRFYKNLSKLIWSARIEWLDINISIIRNKYKILPAHGKEVWGKGDIELHSEQLKELIFA